jgi:hypothetical protein
LKKIKEKTQTQLDPVSLIISKIKIKVKQYKKYDAE